MPSRALLYLRTIGRMRPGMVASRLRGQRRLSEHVFAGVHRVDVPRIVVPELDLDSGYLARFDIDALLDGEFLLINERYRVDMDVWNVPCASHLWNFNLHYFEYGVALAARWHDTGDARCLECFKRLVLSWMKACPYPRGDAWHPYTVSLRLINWLIAMDLFEGELQKDTEFFDTLRESMYRQYRHLLANQETSLRANHWWENLKTLTIMSAAFGERDVLVGVVRRLGGQLDEQILSDGVHFERSLMYHKLVLEGMLRVWLASQGLGFGLPGNFVPKLKLMLDAITSLERGMGKTPFFNDSADGIAKECRQLAAACDNLLDMEGDDSKTVFPDAGYYKLYNGDAAVMFDVGNPGPSYMLGHAHCDCLSFELSYRGEPIIVNSGTYAYQSESRPYFRSTAAHSTCVVDGEEQLECWGEHRVGRGYRNPRIEEVAERSLTGEMVLPSGRRLRRTIVLMDDPGVLVEDEVLEGNAQIESYVHVAPQALATLESMTGDINETETDYSPEFGLLGVSKAFSVRADSRVSYLIRIVHGEGGGFLAD